MTFANLQLIENADEIYSVTRLERRNFVEEIISKTTSNVVKDYIYVESRRIIA